MTGKSIATAFVLIGGLLAIALPAVAQDGKVVVLQGQPAAAAVSVTRNEGGTGVTVYRGVSGFVPQKPPAIEPVAFISGQRIKIDNIEPVGNWFLDRSEGRLVIIHCYTRQSVNVGRNRPILCNARRL